MKPKGTTSSVEKEAGETQTEVATTFNVSLSTIEPYLVFGIGINNIYQPVTFQSQVD